MQGSLNSFLTCKDQVTITPLETENLAGEEVPGPVATVHETRQNWVGEVTGDSINTYWRVFCTSNEPAVILISIDQNRFDGTIHRQDGVVS